MNARWEASYIKHPSRIMSYNLMVHWDSDPFKLSSIDPQGLSRY